jgi:hypothetical protein
MEILGHKPFKTTRSIIFTSMVLIGFSNSLHAEDKCVSLFSKIADQFNKVVPAYIDIRTEAAQVLAGVVLPDAELDELTEKIKQVQIDAYKAVGEIVGDKNSPGSVNLTVPYHNWEGGSLFERTFIVSNNSFDEVKVKVKKTGGKNGADIIVCKFDTEGGFIKKKTATIDKGKDTEGAVRTIEFKGMKNEKYLTIHIANIGFLTNKFKYDLTVTGEFDEAKLAEENYSRPAVEQATQQNPVLEHVNKPKVINR